MGVSKELLSKTTAKEFVNGFLNNAAQRIVNKGAELSDVDLYNLCLINKERDEIDAEEKSNKCIHSTPKNRGV